MPTNSINQDQEYAYIPSEFMSLDYFDTSGEWINIPGIQDADLGPTAAPVRDIIGANAAPQARIGRLRVPRATFNALAIPTDVAWRRLRTAQTNRETLTFRFQTNGEAVFTSASSNGATAQISSSSVLTFTAGSGGTDPQSAPTVAGSYGLGRGAVVKIGTNYAMISKVSSTGAMTVVNVDTWAAFSSAVSAASCVIYNPAAHRYEFSAQVSEGAPDINLGAESEATTTLTLVPRKPIGLPTIVKE